MARTSAETGEASDRAHSVPPGVGRAPQSPPEPAACAPRVGGLDLARCLAIFGMVYVNFEVVLAAGEREPRWLGVLAACTEGRAAATFVVLAGIGLV
ncbi:MAG: heparan-alpha-glucosaminide N-acetyltransferase domain-containing protein, partial [Planctomycetota bacterium]|nr:heparan-alpha-glucosaminide N-acetyltransferase domain-containing protein [Planctomycetota bacterium]